MYTVRMDTDTLINLSSYIECVAYCFDKGLVIKVNDDYYLLDGIEITEAERLSA